MKNTKLKIDMLKIWKNDELLQRHNNQTQKTIRSIYIYKNK